jgi:hypothetical protein
MYVWMHPHIHIYIYTYMDIGIYVTYIHNQLIFLHALLSAYDGALHDD